MSVNGGMNGEGVTGTRSLAEVRALVGEQEERGASDERRQLTESARGILVS